MHAAFSAVRVASKAYGQNRLQTFLRLRSLKVSRGFQPKEALQLGLLDCRTAPRVDRFVSKNELISFQRAVNPPAWEAVTEDKDIFYRYADAVNLPVPKLLGVFFRDCAVWSAASGYLSSPTDWTRFFLQECPSSFVVKPARGAYGYGVRIVDRTDGRFSVSSGETVLPQDLPRTIFLPLRYRSFVIQERLRTHASIQQLSGSETLQTVRIITACAADGSVALLAAGIKLAVGTAAVDNPGEAIAIHTSVSLEDGSIRRAVMTNPSGAGYSPLRRHPVTGRSLIGFELPFAAEIFELAAQAAALFRPIRSIGWDIAITDRGPVIVEGNQWWGPPNDREDAAGLFDRLKSLIG